MKNRFIILLCAVIFGACNYNKFDDIDSSGTLPWTPNSSLQSVTEFSSPMASDFIVEGTVVSSDSAGNFYKELIISDQKFSSLRLTFNFYDTYSIYGLGDVVAVNLKGLVVGREDGILTAGFATGDSVEIGKIPSIGIARKFINYQGRSETIVAKRVKIEEITEKLIGNVVYLENCHFDSNLGTLSESKEICQEGSEQKIPLYVSPYCSFAGNPATSARFNIEAIVIKNGKKLALKINSEKAIFTINLY